MRLRQRRGTGVNRKAIGAAVIAGVLVVGGVTGLQFASAGEATKAADIVVVDGQNFDVAGCEALEINVGAVICDGEELAPEQAMGAAEAATASAQALEDSCDQFAIDQAAAEQQAAGEEAGGEKAGEAEAEEAAAAPKSKKAKRAIAKKYAKGMGEKEAAEQAGAAEEAGAAEDAEAGAAEDLDAAVTDARAALLVACLDLATAKGAAADAAGDAGAGADEEQGAEEQGAKEQGASSHN